MTPDISALTDAELRDRMTAQAEGLSRMTREPLPARRPCESREVGFNGNTYAVCVGFYPDGRPGEVFADGPKEGSDIRATIADACVLISIALQHGITTADLGHSLGRVPRWVDGNEGEGPASIIGAIIEAIEPTGVNA